MLAKYFTVNVTLYGMAVTCLDARVLGRWQLYSQRVGFYRA